MIIVASEDKPTAAFILSLIGGILILVGGVGMTAMMSMWGWGMMRGWGGVMGPWMMGGWAFIPSMLTGLGVFGIICGIIVIVGAAMLNSKPEEHTKWGTLILIFSILSIFGGMGGFLVGLILGVIGGALAISWKPK